MEDGNPRLLESVLWLFESSLLQVLTGCEDRWGPSSRSIKFALLEEQDRKKGHLFFKKPVPRVPTKGCRPSPLPLRVAKAGKNHLNEEITPPPPHWDWRAIQPNHIKFMTCSALAPMWTPSINESAKLTQGANCLLWGSSYRLVWLEVVRPVCLFWKVCSSWGPHNTEKRGELCPLFR